MSLFGPPNIVKLKGKRDTAGLIRALDYEKDQEIAAAAAAALGELRDPAAIEPLIAVVTARRGYYGAAIRALGQIGDPRAVDCLIGVLEAPAKHPNLLAIEALGRIGDPRAVETISRFLVTAQGGGLAEVAAGNALCAIGGDRALDLLIRAKKTLEVERFGATAVERLIAALEWTWSDGVDPALLKSWVCERLAETGDPRAVEPLCGLLRNASGFVREGAVVALRKSAAAALGRMRDPRAVDPLVAALGDAEPAVRAAAASALAYFHGGADAAEPLIAALRDRDRGVQSEACQAVPCDPRAVAPLVALLDPQVGLAWVAATKLGKIGDPRAVEPLIAVLASARPNTGEGFEEVVGALGAIGDRRAVGPLIERLGEPKARDREAVIEALAAIGDPRAIEPIIAASKGLSERFVDQALERLRKPRSRTTPGLYR